MTLLLVILAVFVAIGIGVCWGYSQRVDHAVDDRTKVLANARDDALKEAQAAQDRETAAEALLEKVTKKK